MLITTVVHRSPRHFATHLYAVFQCVWLYCFLLSVEIIQEDFPLLPSMQVDFFLSVQVDFFFLGVNL